MIKNFICFFIYFFSVYLYAEGQTNINSSNTDTGYYRYALKTYTTHEGLPSESTTGALKDKRGFMWIGTMNGLCRFDGYSFKNLVNIPGDSTSITNNYIKSLTQDSQGRIWVGTMDGLNILDPLTEKFKRIYHKEKIKGSLSNNKIWSVFCDSEGIVWVGTDDGFNRYNKDGTFAVYQPDEKNRFAMKGKSVNSIIEDKYHNLWLGNWSSGLNKFDKKTRRFTNYPQAQTLNQKNPNDVWSLCYDARAQRIWVGTYWSGLFSYDPSTGKYKAYPSTDPENKTAFSVLQIGESKLIIGGDAGFYWVDIQSGHWSKIGNLMSTADRY
jgi:ligand-binding sensor domain-containing protein